MQPLMFQRRAAPIGRLAYLNCWNEIYLCVYWCLLLGRLLLNIFAATAASETLPQQQRTCQIIMSDQFNH